MIPNQATRQKHNHVHIIFYLEPEEGFLSSPRAHVPNP
jgi:hypothetical protein